jgi:hypothetical protein
LWLFFFIAILDPPCRVADEKAGQQRAVAACAWRNTKLSPATMMRMTVNKKTRRMSNLRPVEARSKKQEARSKNKNKNKWAKRDQHYY